MKALSIKEPWATMIRDGRKTIETRTWNTKYRGEVLLCASKKPIGQYHGRAFAIAKIVNSRPMTEVDEFLARCKLFPNAYAWELEDVTPIEPFPVKGQLGLFDVEIKDGMIVKVKP